MTTLNRISRVVLAIAILSCLPMAADAGLLDLSGAPVTASSTFAGDVGGLGPHLAFDNNLSTRWASNNVGSDPLPQWIYVELPSTLQIDQVDISWEFAYAGGYRIAVFDGLAPPDPETMIGSWNTIGTVTGRTGAGTGAPGVIGESFDFNAATWTPFLGGGTPGPLTTGDTGNFLLLWKDANDGAIDLISPWEIDVFASEPSTLPEPAAFAMAALGLLSLGLVSRRRRNR